jgi:hypothetical protein
MCVKRAARCASAPLAMLGYRVVLNFQAEAEGVTVQKLIGVMLKP